MSTIILIEKERTPPALASTLQGDGYDLVQLPSENKVTELVPILRPDLLLFSVRQMDSALMEVFRRVRSDDDVPIMVLTEGSAEEERAGGLTAGADDCIFGPFSLSDLTQRIQAILRCRLQRSQNAAQYQIYRHLHLSHVTRKLKVKGEAVEMTRLEFDLLSLFMENPGRVFSREELMSAVWGREEDVAQRTIDVHIHWLRKKIEVDPSRPLIQTVRKIGYRFGD